MQFSSKHPPFEYLHKKWTAKHKNLSDNLIDKHLKNVALGSLGGLMLFGGVNAAISNQPVLPIQPHITPTTNKNALLSAELKDKVPDEVRNLNSEEEKKVEEVLTKFLGTPVKASIDGVRLNKTYALIGAEQHLYRYPGDNVFAHAKSTTDWAMYGDSGIAPGLGAWGYFAPSKEQFSEEDEQRERYYIAVQTFLAPGFAENVAKYRDFFKYRKMLVVNPKTGQAVVTDIADAGPSEWTGKHLGGSPEVMFNLGLAEGPRKGAVLYFFIDDPQNAIPLGPVVAPNNI